VHTFNYRYYVAAQHIGSETVNNSINALEFIKIVHLIGKIPHINVTTIICDERKLRNVNFFRMPAAFCDSVVLESTDTRRHPISFQYFGYLGNEDVDYINNLPEEARMVEITSNIWGTKFKIQGLHTSLPPLLGQV
jgi:hypothetical protein